MSVLVYAESWDSQFRKSTYEAVSYAKETAKILETDVIAIAFGGESDEELSKLGNYGASKVIVTNGVNKGDSKTAADFLTSNADDANIVVFASTYTSKMIAPRLSVKIKSGLVSNVISPPLSISPITIKRKSFSSKANEKTSINSEKGIIMLATNAFGLIEHSLNCEIHRVKDVDEMSVKIDGEEVASDEISLAEAEIVVSAGRGLKGPENWKMIEELAELLKAATACSKPVSDIGWRPHREHVGQTGVAVAPNLYIAVGISGAIQHLAGVNSSKVMVAINTDPDAPFFKAADYGIVGDAFKIIPKLIQEIKKIK
jgi:electron transfer flavoprotein alpha subunit